MQKNSQAQQFIARPSAGGHDKRWGNLVRHKWPDLAHDQSAPVKEVTAQ